MKAKLNYIAFLLAMCAVCSIVGTVGYNLAAEALDKPTTTYLHMFICTVLGVFVIDYWNLLPEK